MTRAMTPERHIWACANEIMRQHGNDAWFFASQRADALHEAGDAAGYKMFVAILKRIEDFQSQKPGTRLH